MQDFNNLPFHPTMEKVTQILCRKTQNSDPMFFRILVSYYFAKVASMMRAQVDIKGQGSVPVNMYAFNLSPSGAGKNRSMTIMEEQVIHKFQSEFLDITFEAKAAEVMAQLAMRRAAKNQSNPDAELSQIEEEFRLVPMMFSFDSATVPAIKQLRQKLLMAGIGSLAFECDEVGDNLLSTKDALLTFLELWDIGRTKSKLIKSTRDNSRNEEIMGRTPTNMLMFGTPSKLLDSSKTEDEFYQMLEAGYARRCFFGFSRHRKGPKEYTAQEMLDIFSDTQDVDYLHQLSEQIALLANPINANMILTMQEAVALEYLNYRINCDKRSEAFSDHDEIRKTEMIHRHSKAIKLAGAYAFIDGSAEITMDHLHYAIAMTEESGNSLEQIMRRDKPYVKLANYICSIRKEVTQADMVEDLAFYKGSESQRKEMLNLAIAYGYKNNQIIKRELIDGVEFFSGKSLPETDLTKLVLSYSTDYTTGYDNKTGSWQNIPKLCLSTGNHWVNHHLMPNTDHPNKGGYRDELHVIPGFNLLVIDVDGDVSLDIAQQLMSEYTYYLHTTKSHTDKEHCFRMIFPMSHTLSLDHREYREFFNNVYAWLPFKVDTQTNQRSRKWLTHPGQGYSNQGVLLDVLKFIPKTKKAEEIKQRMVDQASLSALERWFVNQMSEGNRNNMLLRYACCLADMGHDLDSVKNNVLALNSKIAEPLSESEILGTVILTVSKKC